LLKYSMWSKILVTSNMVCFVRTLYGLCEFMYRKILSMNWHSSSVDGVLRFVPQRQTRLVSEFVDDIREAIAVDVVCPVLSTIWV